MFLPGVKRTCFTLTAATFLLFMSSVGLADDDSVEDLTFDDIKFEMEKTERFKRSMLTDDIEGLVGKRIKIRGYILPDYKTKLTRFKLVRDNQECCFGPGAALYDCVLVTLEDGEATEWTARPVTVEGEFFIKELKGPDKRIWAIYRMKNALVK